MEGKYLEEKPTQLTQLESNLKNLNYLAAFENINYDTYVQKFVKNTHTHSFTVVHWIFWVINFQSSIFWIDVLT